MDAFMDLQSWDNYLAAPYALHGEFETMCSAGEILKSTLDLATQKPNFGRLRRT
jgi:hypothetical protein